MSFIVILLRLTEVCFTEIKLTWENMVHNQITSDQSSVKSSRMLENWKHSLLYMYYLIGLFCDVWVCISFKGHAYVEIILVFPLPFVQR